MPKPRIRAALLGSRGVPARYGAFEYCADRIATLGGRDDVDWTIYCPAESEPPPIYGNARTARVRHGEGRSAALFYDVRCLWHACRGDARVILMLGYGAGPFLALARIFKKRLITNTDGFEYKRSKWPWWVKLWFRFAEACAARLSHALISDSVNVAEYYERRYGKRSAFIAYGTEVPDAAALDAARPKLAVFLAEHGLEERGYHVVVMRLEPENSLHEIVEAGARLEGRPILVVGPPTPVSKALLRDREGEAWRLVVAGPVYDRALLFLLRSRALSYIHGHTVGGINPTLLEALSTGTPVVSRSTPFNREVLGDAGHYFEDASSLRAQLARIEVCDADAWTARARAVGARWRPHFTWEEVTRRYEESVRDVARRGAVGRGASGASRPLVR